MEPQPPGKATDVLCRMFSSKFMDIDKEKLTALLGVLRSLKQADDENKTGTFKVVISILYKYCSTLSGTPEVGDYDKTVKFIKMVMGQHPDLARCLACLIPKPKSSMRKTAIINSTTSSDDGDGKPPVISHAGSPSTKPQVPQPTGKEDKTKNLVYKFYNYTSPSINTYVATNGKPKKVVTKTTNENLTGGKPIRPRALDPSTTPVYSSVSQVQQAPLTTPPVKYIHHGEYFTKVSTGQRRITPPPRHVYPTPNPKLTCTDVSTSTCKTIQGTVVKTINTAAETCYPPVSSPKGSTLGVLPLQKRVATKRKDVDCNKSEVISCHSEIINTEQNVRNFPYTQQFIIDAGTGTVEPKSDEGRHMTSTSTAASLDVQSSTNYPVVYVQSIGRPKAAPRPPASTLGPGNSRVYRLAFPLSTRMKAFNGSTMRPLIIKKNVNTTGNTTAVSKPSFGEAVPQEDQPLDLSLKKGRGENRGSLTETSVGVPDSSHSVYEDITKQLVFNMLPQNVQFYPVEGNESYRKDGDQKGREVERRKTGLSKLTEETYTQGLLSSDLSIRCEEEKESGSSLSATSAYSPDVLKFEAKKRHKKHEHHTGKRRKNGKGKI